MSKKEHFEIQHQHNEEDGIHIVHFKGHFDSVSSPAAEAKMSEVIEKGDRIVANFSELIYISSAGLRVLLVALKKSKNKNTRIVFCALGENVRKVFEISNFLSILDVAGTHEEAVERVKKHKAKS
ncbi:MAG TPA: anti-sigma factor antagonist [Lentisphaeria bacterium]|nr:MAG: hypothetical protein A2X48_03495 [Lentisphaerae bacterium GWF2_49_21]HBC88147.1 anti-sigma factor antagonist [Lentisphaeria bacterium]